MVLNFNKIFCFIFLILSLQNIFAYNEKDLDEICDGEKFMAFADLVFAPLNGRNLNRVNLSKALVYGASFRRASLKNARLCSIKAVNASFRWADLEGADLRDGNFRDALFFGANLKNTKVKDAGFRNVRGLTNVQKKYLRENGAVFVPADLTPEEFEKERLQVDTEIKSSIGYKVNKMFSRAVDCIFCGCTKSKKKKKTE